MKIDIPEEFRYFPNSNRLNAAGFTHYCKDNEPHIYKVENKFKARHLILISKYVESPYFFSPDGKRIAIFCDETAFLLKLNGENFDLWLDSQEH